MTERAFEHVSWPRAAAGLALVVVVPVLLLRPLVAAFDGGEAVVWLNPNHVFAGFGFAGLLLGFVAAFAWTLARRRPLNEGSVAVAVILVVTSLVALAGKDVVVARMAKSAHYQRCRQHDRFQAGNIKRNDVTLQAWAKACAPPSSSP